MADPTRRSTRFSVRSKQLGQLLLESGDVQAEQVAQALKRQEKEGGLIGQILQRMDACSAGAIAAALLKQVQVTDVKCEELNIDSEVSALISHDLCQAEKLCPFEKLGNLLCLVMANPLNRKAISQIENRTQLKVKSFKAPWAPIHELIQRTYGAEVASAPADSEAEQGDDDLNVLAPGDIGGAEPPAMEIPSPDAPLSIELPEPVPIEEAANMAALSRRPKPQPQQPAGPTIQGIDQIDENTAQLIAMDSRGMSPRARPEVAAAKPRPPKVVKVNVDLDALDISRTDVVVGAADPGESNLVELQQGAAQGPVLTNAGTIISPKLVPDSYFYPEDVTPEEGRSDELLDLLAQVPVAETLSESIADYQNYLRARGAPQARGVNVASRAVELQPAPIRSVAAKKIREDEFHQAIATLVEDAAGEWDWKYTAAGPLEVAVADEN